MVPKCNANVPLDSWVAEAIKQGLMLGEVRKGVLDFTSDWRVEFKRALRTAADLLEAGFIGEGDFPAFDELTRKYQFLLPRYYASLIDRANPHCPIRLQAIPSLKELTKVPGLYSDPLSDLKHKPASRITHRYRGRVLLHLTPNCSMYCRYCFRKSLLNSLKRDFFDGSLEEAFDYLRTQSEIREVIFSGGDPLMVSDEEFERVLQEISSISHIERLRIHTRVPVTFPMRITSKLIKILKSFPRKIIIVTHLNHPKEITPLSSQAIERFRTGFVLLNQSVLLRGVNDSWKTLAMLSEGMFEMGVLPYYLHHPDRAQGTGHFDLTVEEGMQIFEKLRSELSGYLVPRYVIDKVGVPYKVPVG